jgi:hypothetical protein
VVSIVAESKIDGRVIFLLLSFSVFIYLCLSVSFE